MAITNDTRVRNISHENVKKLEKLSKIFKINTTTGVLLRLIPQYFENQAEIKTLETKNKNLERGLLEARQELANLKGEIQTFFELEKKINQQKQTLLSEV